MVVILSLIVSIGLSFLIAHFLGRKRQIGFKYSLLFCLTLSPVIGFIITMVSRKYYSDNPDTSLLKKVFGWFFIIIGGMALLGTLNESSYSTSHYAYYRGYLKLIPQLGLIWLGYYMIQRGKGKRFDNDLVKVEEKSENNI